MNDETVRKWFIKADHDLKTGKDELATEEPATDTVCFHMQQGVEKYLKGFLVYSGKELIRTHDLSTILQQTLDVDVDFGKLRALNVEQLTDHAVQSRYPDDFYIPPVEEAQRALQIAEEVKRFVLEKLQVQGFTRSEEQPD